MLKTIEKKMQPNSHGPKREKKKGSYRDFKYNLFLIATLEINKSCRLFIFIKIKFCIF